MPNKAVAAGAAGAATIVFVWVMSLFHIEVPGYVASAFTTLIAAGATYVTPHEGNSP